MSVEDQMVPGSSLATVQNFIGVENLEFLMEAGINKIKTWSSKPKIVAIVAGVAIFGAGLFFKYSDQIFKTIGSEARRIGFMDMNVREKSLYIANLLQIIPTLGAPLLATVTKDPATIAGGDKAFTLIDNIVDIIQASSGGIASFLQGILARFGK